MRNPRFLLALTLLNLLLLVLAVARSWAGTQPATLPVLRGRGLEIVDDRGRVRASISVLPADPDYRMPDGTRGYPETVLLRLITPEGRPNVKIGASKDGSGLGLGGEDDPTYVQLLAQGSSTSIKLTNRNGREQVLKP